VIASLVDPVAGDRGSPPNVLRPQIDRGRLIVFAVLLAAASRPRRVTSYTRARRAWSTAQAGLAMLAREVVEDLHKAGRSSRRYHELVAPRNRAVRYRDVDKRLAQFFRQLLSIGTSIADSSSVKAWAGRSWISPGYCHDR
jgi:hypothetical protein